MRKTRVLAGIFVIMLLCMVTACNRNRSNGSDTELTKQAQAICGSWAYIHDTAKEIADFNTDGTAKYKGKDYTFECDDTYIYLKGKEDIKMRYLIIGDRTFFYETKTYTFDGEGEPDGLIGIWAAPEDSWSFEFTENGTFKEDGYFPGNYSVDTENSSFKLVYNDHFEDTTCYYKIEGKELVVEYPWRMVPTEIAPEE